MTYKTDMLEGIDAIYENGGVEALFSARDFSETTVTAIVDYNLSNYGEVANITGMSAVISVRRSELANVPKQREIFTVDGVEYSVASQIRADELEHAVIVA